jgi:hypothetical protein
MDANAFAEFIWNALEPWRNRWHRSCAGFWEYMHFINKLHFG